MDWPAVALLLAETKWHQYNEQHSLVITRLKIFLSGSNVSFKTKSDFYLVDQLKFIVTELPRKFKVVLEFHIQTQNKTLIYQIFWKRGVRDTLNWLNQNRIVTLILPETTSTYFKRSKNIPTIHKRMTNDVVALECFLNRVLSRRWH